MSESAPHGFAAHEAAAEQKLADNAAAEEAQRQEAAEAAEREALAAKQAAKHEADAQRAANEQAKAQAKAKEEAAAEERRQHYEQARRSTPNRVRALNDKAELEIFGSKGRTYVKNSKNTEVIADADHVLPGKIEEIRKDRTISYRPSEREAAADSYKRSVLHLVDNEGLELTQAKLLLELDEEHVTRSNRLYDKLVGEYLDTMSEPEAEAKAYARVGARENKLGENTNFVYELIKEKHLYNRADYDKFVKSDEYKKLLQEHNSRIKATRLANDRDAIEWKRDERANRREEAKAEDLHMNTNDRGNGKRHWIEDTPIRPMSDEESEIAKEARSKDIADLAEKRDEYIRRAVGRDRRGFQLKSEFRNKSVADAEKAYEELRDEIIKAELKHLAFLGVNEKEIEMATPVVAFGEQLKVAQRMYEMRLIATGNYQVDENTGELLRDENTGEPLEVKTGRLGQMRKHVYDFFGRNDPNGKRFFSKTSAQKSGALFAGGAVIGAASGIVFAPVVGTALAAVGGGVLLSRVTKAYMSTHMMSKGRDAHIKTHAQARLDVMRRALGDGTRDVVVTDLIDKELKRDVRNNRLRIVAGVGAFALGGLLGAEIAQHIDIDGFGGHGGTSHTPTHEPTHTPTHHQGGNHNHHPKHHNGGHNKHHDNGNNSEHLGKHVDVKAGEGYTQVLHDELAKKGVNLTPQQSYDAYQHLADKFPGGKFFTNDASYRLPNGDFGISHAGSATLRPEVLHELNHYAEENHLLKQAA